MASIINVDKVRATGSTTDGLTVDSNGRVVTPNRPFFYAAAGAQRDDQTASPIPYTNAIKNVGGHYDTSTSKFTCPVDGIYFFAGQVYKEGTDSNIKLRVTSGGSDTDVAEVGRMIGTAPTEHSAVSFAITYYFSANDVVFMIRDTGTYHQNGLLSYFTGCLIG